MSKKSEPTCSDCGLLSCYRQDKNFPSFCLTQASDPAQLAEVVESYRGDGEEIIAFANRIGARRIGIATCVGLIEETRLFVKVLEAHGLESYAVLCKVGSVDKTEIGIPDDLKIMKGCHESICNPIFQAKILNEQKTDLNVIVGLCVGHDSLFIKYSDALVTTLITKDRVLAHNPAAALYTSGFYYKRLLKPEGKL